MIKDTLFYFVSKFVPGIINLLTLYIYTRMLTTAQFGEYSVYLTMVSVVYATLFEWLKLSLLRYYDKFEKQKKEFIGTILILNFYVLLIFVACLIFINNVLDFKYINFTSIILLLLLVVSNVIFNISITIMRVKLNPNLFGLISSAKSLFSLIMSLVFFKLELGVMGIILGISIGTLIPSLPVLFRELKNINLKLNKNISKEIRRYGIPLIFTVVMGIGLYSIDRLMLAYYTNLSEVGMYTAAYSVGQQSIFFVMTVVNLASFPIIIKALEKKGSASRELKENYTLLLMLSIPALTGVLLLSDNIIYVMLGPSFRNVSNIIFPLISVGIFFQGLKLYYFDLPFHLSSDTKAQRIPVFIGLIINVVLNLYFIPEYGAVGAAITTNISFLFSLILSWFLGRRLYNLPFDLFMITKVFSATIIMGIVLKKINHWSGILALFCQITLGATTYFVIIYLLNLNDIRIKTLRLIQKIVKK